VIDEMDQTIHDFCTRASHWLQRATGLTCYFVARVGVTLTAISVMANIANYFFPFLPGRTDMVTVALSVLILIDCIPRSIACQRGDEAVGSNAKPAELMRFTRGPFWRVLWVGFAIFDLAYMHWLSRPFASFIQDSAFALGCAVFYNFINVTPLPPGTSKLREWIRGFFSSRELARQEN